MARQEGQYLAALLSKQRLALVEPAADGGQAAADADLVPLPHGTKPFGYMHLGSLAYLGDSKGAMDLPPAVSWRGSTEGGLCTVATLLWPAGAQLWPKPAGLHHVQEWAGCRAREPHACRTPNSAFFHSSRLPS